MASKRRKFSFKNPTMFGFLIGVILWIVIFISLQIYYSLGKSPVEFLEILLAQPLGIFLKIFWKIFNIHSFQITAIIEYLIYISAALMWGLVGSLVGFISGKIYKKLD